MKVIFLDFDGVLNGFDTNEPASPLHPHLHLNPVLMRRLNRIVKRTGAKVVLSTSWRTRHHHPGASAEHMTLDELREALRLAGFVGEVIGVTPDLARLDTIGRTGDVLWRCPPRLKEIRAWLDAHPVSAFVVLDDDGGAELAGHFVHCSRRTGLTESDVEQAVRILGAT